MSEMRSEHDNRIQQADNSGLHCRITIDNLENLTPYEELVKVFLQPSQYSLTKAGKKSGCAAESIAENTAKNDMSTAGSITLQYRFQGDADALKRQIYNDLSNYTGKSPKWGILTGIRPVKLAYELTYGSKATEVDSSGVPHVDKGAQLCRSAACAPSQQSASCTERIAEVPVQQCNSNMDRTTSVLRDHYLLHPTKVNLVTEILDYQRRTAGDPPQGSLSLYLGIPFCPTRCLYCSFPSNQVPEQEIARYLTALEQEIDFAAAAAAEDGFQIESVYFGGGTPTTLDESQLNRLLGCVRDRFRLNAQPLREFTVEAGRPDTITEQKLAVMRKHGVDRISINPQSMQQRTLDLIGRRHTVRQTQSAYQLARQAGFECINTDLIAGLPGESFADFADSLDQVLALGADNVTLHTLAVKRASRLKDMDENFNYREEELRERMLEHAAQRLRGEGFCPYYLYRQKHTSGNTENIGYCRDDRISVYNIRIMEERQSILALGAGGISKIYFPAENRLERVANVSNYEIYIDRIQEMIDRKRQKFFGQGE